MAKSTFCQRMFAKENGGGQIKSKPWARFFGSPEPINKKCGLLIVDVGEDRSIMGRKLISSLIPVIGKFDALGWPICIVHSSKEEETPARILDAISKPRVFIKNGTSAFSNRKLASYLRHEKVGTVLPCGFNKYVCVHSTMRGARKEGFSVKTAEPLLMADWPLIASVMGIITIPIACYQLAVALDYIANSEHYLFTNSLLASLDAK